jgi:sulfhydrogenase subunit beta (sulfur reductase)
MTVKKLSPAAMAAWVDRLVRKGRVVGVKAKGDRFDFDEIESAAELRLDYDVAIHPPKKYFLPPRGQLLAFDGDRYASALDAKPFTLIGAHPYDLAAVLHLDRAFAQGVRDEHYAALRESATIVASDVERASPNVFAGCMETAVLSDGFDALLTKVDGGYLLDVRTDKGKALLAALEGAKDADANDLAAREKVWEKNRRELRRHELKPALTEVPALVSAGANHPVWEEKASQCFSCGSCNLVCPACFCFDVREDAGWDLARGSRTRSWDACMLDSFARVAGGHNFRSKPAQRYRHRYSRLGKYMHDLYGFIGCVGCGRCITACVTKIANPVEVYNRLAEKKA